VKESTEWADQIQAHQKKLKVSDSLGDLVSYLLIDRAKSFLFHWYAGVCQLLRLGVCVLLNSSSSVFSTEHEYLVAIPQWCCTAMFTEAIYMM